MKERTLESDLAHYHEEPSKNLLDRFLVSIGKLCFRKSVPPVAESSVKAVAISWRSPAGRTSTDASPLVTNQPTH